MYKLYSKLSEKEKREIQIKYNLRNHILRDITDDDLKSNKSEDALLDLTVTNLTKQLDGINGIGTYTILMKKDGRFAILYYDEPSNIVRVRISAVVKAVFGIVIMHTIHVKN